MESKCMESEKRETKRRGMKGGGEKEERRGKGKEGEKTYEKRRKRYE